MRNRHYRCSTHEMIVNELNSDEKFIVKKCVAYLGRHLTKFSSLEKETLSMISWVLGKDAVEIVNFFISIRDKRYRTLVSDFTESDSDPDDYGEIFFQAYKKSEWKVKNRFRKHILQLLEQHGQRLACKKLSGTEKTLLSLRELFSLTPVELELCIFLFMAKTYDAPESYFDYHLECFKYKGRKFLLNMLAISSAEFQKALVDLKRFEIIDIDK